jgi:hypothetical protein
MLIRFIIRIFLFLFLLFGVIWYPIGNSYVDKLYQHEYSIYKSEKSKFDSIETNKINIIKDSIYNAWLANNDTTLKTIKKINKRPNYAAAGGYYRKTGKLICKYKDKNEMICEPEEEWIKTDYYINGYVLDTIWTAGYDNRNQWLNKAKIFAQTETNKISPKKEFGPYKASSRLIAFRQNFSYETRNVIGVLSVLIFSILILLYIIYLIKISEKIPYTIAELIFLVSWIMIGIMTVAVIVIGLFAIAHFCPRPYGAILAFLLFSGICAGIYEYINSH